MKAGLREAYALFYSAYREAAEKLKAGDRTAQVREPDHPERYLLWVGNS